MDQMAFRINDLADKIGLSRSKIYQLIKTGELRAICIGGRRLVSASEVTRLIEGAAQ